MKVYELAKELKISSTDALKVLQGLGFQYKAIANNIPDNDLERAKEALKDVPREDTKPEEPKISNELKKGAMIGVVYDGTKFKIISIKVSDDDIMNRWDYQVISTHTSIFGAMIEIAKKVPKVINEFTVKVFKEK